MHLHQIPYSNSGMLWTIYCGIFRGLFLCTMFSFCLFCRLIVKELVRLQGIKPDEEIKSIVGSHASYDERPALFIKSRQFLDNIVDQFPDDTKTKR